MPSHRLWVRFRSPDDSTSFVAMLASVLLLSACGQADTQPAAMASGVGGGASASSASIGSGGAGGAGGHGTGSGTGGSGGAGGRAAPVYPLKMSTNHRTLVDQNDVPFLIAGDAPQSLMVNLSEADAEMYFQNRKSHGYNSVWINLLCDDYTAGPADGSTLDGIHPFTSAGDFSTPNEAYFQRTDAMLKLAAKYDLNVFLDPVETGGWLNAMLSNGPDKCRQFGRYLGARYQSFDNILWMSGNDYQGWADPQNDPVVTAVALGIKDMDTRHIHTIELDYPHSSSFDDANWVPIISLSAAYSYYPTYAQVLGDYNRPNFLPVFLVEAVYEFESNLQANESTPSTLRRQEYWTNLSGATGQLYGNHYTWTFTSGWQGKLDSPGAIQMANVKALFESRPWYDLVPDQNHTVVTSGYGTFTDMGYVDDSDYATAARTPDGGLVMAYLPTVRTVQVDMSQLKGPATARWFDPSNGTYAMIAGSPFPNSGTQSFMPAGTNGDGDGDWVLVLEAP